MRTSLSLQTIFHRIKISITTSSLDVPMQKEVVTSILGLLVVGFLLLFALDYSGIPLGKGTEYRAAPGVPPPYHSSKQIDLGTQPTETCTDWSAHDPQKRITGDTHAREV